jgi:hypothetical protein
MLSSMCQAHLSPADVLEYKSPGFSVNLTSFRAIEKRQTFKKGLRNFVSFIVSIISSVLSELYPTDLPVLERILVLLRTGP